MSSVFRKKNNMNISVSNKGAELTSIVANGRERLWQGDPVFWGRRAPILFPIVGKLADDKLNIKGHEYIMKQHGFARDTEFVQKDGWFVLAENGRDNYPYEYELAVNYKADGNTLTCNWHVKNCSDGTMFFQIGAHPAFLLPKYDSNDEIHGYIQCYDADNNIVSPLVFSTLVNGLRVHYSQPKVLLNDNGILALTNTTFAYDAIMIEAKQVAKVALFDKQGKQMLAVGCPQADAFGLWAPNKPGCPFVCIEPWCGIADNAGFKGDISERDCIHSVESGETYDFTYTINFA